MATQPDPIPTPDPFIVANERPGGVPSTWVQSIVQNLEATSTIDFQWRKGSGSYMSEGDPYQVRCQIIETAAGRRKVIETPDGHLHPHELARVFWDEAWDLYLRERSMVGGHLSRLGVRIVLFDAEGGRLDDPGTYIEPKAGMEGIDGAHHYSAVFTDTMTTEEREERNLVRFFSRRERQLFDQNVRLMEMLEGQAENSVRFVNGLGSAFQNAFNLQQAGLDARADEISRVREAEIADMRTDKLIGLLERLGLEYMRRATPDKAGGEDDHELRDLCLQILDQITPEQWEQLARLGPDAPEHFGDLRSAFRRAEAPDVSRGALVAALSVTIPPVEGYPAAIAIIPPAVLPMLQRVREIVMGGLGG